MNYHRFTVIIPEHNRPNHLKRLLDYYLNVGVNIIVSDSSVNMFPYLNQYGSLIKYKHYPSMPLAQKIVNVLDDITTPYVLMCANDDFIVPEAINQIIDFLELHPSYNSGQGMYVDFDPLQKEIIPSMRYGYMLENSLTEDTGAERISHLMRNYYQYYYAVYRTEVFYQTYRSTVRHDKVLIKNLCLLEAYVSLYPAIIGKHIVLPLFYCARENIINSAGSTEDGIVKVAQEDRYKEQWDAYSDLLVNLLSHKDNISTDKAKKVLHHAMTSHFLRISNPNRLLYKILVRLDVFGLRFKLLPNRYSRQIISIDSRIKDFEKFEIIKKSIFDNIDIYQ